MVVKETKNADLPVKNEQLRSRALLFFIIYVLPAFLNCRNFERHQSYSKKSVATEGQTFF